MGMFIMPAIFTALLTMRETSSCGEVIIRIPSRVMVWKTVNGTSPVPGGMSISRKSMCSQITSVQNCFTIPATSGPRHSTGDFSSAINKLLEITSMPVSVTAG